MTNVFYSFKRILTSSYFYGYERENVFMAKLFGGYKSIFFLCESHSHKFSKCPGWVRYELCWYFSFHYLQQIFLQIYMFQNVQFFILGLWAKNVNCSIHTWFRFSPHLICYYHHAVLRFLLQNGNNPEFLWMSPSLSCLCLFPWGREKKKTF